MKALTIKQPWASLIAHGIKDIENRTWKTNYRGRIYIHASKTPACFHALSCLNNDQARLVDLNLSSFDWQCDRLISSAIIGEVDIVDCVINHPSIWAEHTNNFLLEKEIVKPVYNWVLANPVIYKEPILNVKGKLSFWEFNH